MIFSIITFTTFNVELMNNKLFLLYDEASVKIKLLMIRHSSEGWNPLIALPPCPFRVNLQDEPLSAGYSLLGYYRPSLKKRDKREILPCHSSEGFSPRAGIQLK
jgi:hypothetical protein